MTSPFTRCYIVGFVCGRTQEGGFGESVTLMADSEAKPIPTCRQTHIFPSLILPPIPLFFVSFPSVSISLRNSFALPQLDFPGFHTVLREGKLHALTVLATSALLARAKQLERGQRKGSGFRSESVKGLGVVRPRTVVRV